MYRLLWNFIPLHLFVCQDVERGCPEWDPSPGWPMGTRALVQESISHLFTRRRLRVLFLWMHRVVFMDISIGGHNAGRIKMEVHESRRPAETAHLPSH